jgi:alkylation response protein AidB-like acyl-CoA dehydrogenase
MVTTDIDGFRAEVRAWLASTGLPLRGGTGSGDHGAAADTVAVFHDLPHDDELALLDRLRAWQRTKYEAGYGAITWPAPYGPALGPAHEDAFAAEELAFATPGAHELMTVTLNLIAPTLRELATPELCQELVGPLLRGEQLACQLFSEPGAGSDLANVGTRAVRDPSGETDDWLVTGQKVWTSGAQFAQWGELVARTDPDVPKHRGLTAFMVPLDAPGLEVRPLRQMSGGTSFNEVFLDSVRIPDRYRIAGVGEGWKVALTTLGFERGDSARQALVGGDWRRAFEVARRSGADTDPLVRQRMAETFIAWHLGEVAAARDEKALADGQAAGAVGSLRKLQWVHRMQAVADLTREALGPGIAVDTGERGTFAWTQQLLGVPGYRIAGGSDQIQKNIIGERLLGLAPEPRADRDRPWRETRR